MLDVIAGDEVCRGGHSWLEREFLRLVAAAGLPRPSSQQVLSRAADRMVRVDARFPGTNVVVELLGYRFHRSKAQLERDTQRLNALIQDGFCPLQFTYERVVSDAEGMIATIERSLSRFV